VSVTRRDTVDRHHLSTGWTGLLEAHGSLVEVLVEAASSGETGMSCWRWGGDMQKKYVLSVVGSV